MTELYNELFDVSGLALSNRGGDRYKSSVGILKRMNEYLDSQSYKLVLTRLVGVRRKKYLAVLLKHQVVEALDKCLYIKLCSLFHPDTNSSKYAMAEYQRVQEWWAECNDEWRVLNYEISDE